jgi:hypothetical protein
MAGRETMPVQRLGLDEVVEHCDHVARAVRESGFRPDTVVAVARGGFVPARFVCDFLGVSRLLSLQLRHYGSGGRIERHAEVSEPLAGSIAGCRVLLVDDVNDSGDTLKAARPYLDDLRPAELRMAVLHEKASTSCRADYRSGFIHEWRWMLYPWAVVEDAGQFLRDLRPAAVSIEEAGRRLLELHGLELSETELRRVAFFAGLDLE